jgi:hypothetical protein
MDRRAFIKAVGASAGTGLLAAKSGGHALRPHLLPAAQDQSQPVFAGQTVGVKQTADHIWLVSFMDYDLGVLRRRDV